MQYQIGDIVTVRAFPNEVLTRRVVGYNERGQTIHLCNEAEYQAAIKESREPICIGFPLYDVIGLAPEMDGEPRCK